MRPTPIFLRAATRNALLLSYRARPSSVFKPTAIKRPLPRIRHHIFYPTFGSHIRAMASTSSNVPKTMSGILIEENGGVEVLKWKEDLSVPELKEGEVLVKNEFVGVNFIDTYFRTGLYNAPLPLVTGREAAGVVAASRSPSFTPGQRVAYVLDHAYAEYTAVPDTKLLCVPADVDTQTAAAALLQGLTALTFVREIPVKPGQTVLVLAAAGGVGQWLVQILRRMNVTVIAAAGSDGKLAVAKGLGATHGVNYSTSDLVTEVKALTASHPMGGPDVIFDGVGKTTFDADLEMIGRKGTVCVFGNASGAVPPVDVLRLGKKNTRLMRPVLFPYITTREELEKYTQELWGLIEAGVKVSVHEVYPLKEVARAHTDLEGRKTMGKLVLKI